MVISTALAALLLAGAVPQSHQHIQPQRDKKAMDARGNIAMGFDQTKITNRFLDREDGGEIEIKAKSAADAATIGQIQSHLKEIERSFAEGDFCRRTVPTSPPARLFDALGCQHADAEVEAAVADRGSRGGRPAVLRPPS